MLSFSLSVVRNSRVKNVYFTFWWCWRIIKMLLSSLLGAKFFFSFLFLNWSIVDSQCCANICCTAKWLSYTHINPFFKCYFSLWFIPGDWIQFLLLYSRTLLILNVMFEIYKSLYFTHQFKTNLMTLENLGFPEAPLVITPFLREKIFLNILPGEKQRLSVFVCAGNIWMKLRSRHIITDFKKIFKHFKDYNLRQISQFIVHNTWSYIVLLKCNETKKRKVLHHFKKLITCTSLK